MNCEMRYCDMNRLHRCLGHLHPILQGHLKSQIAHFEPSSVLCILKGHKPCLQCWPVLLLWDKWMAFQGS